VGSLGVSVIARALRVAVRPLVVPEVVLGSARVGPVRGRVLDGAGGAQSDGDVGGGGLERLPLGEQGLVGHGQPHPAVVVGVAQQQAPVDEDSQRDTQRRRQAGQPDPPPGASAGVIDRDQTSQPGQNFTAGQATGRYRLSERGVGMAGQRALDTAEVVIAAQSHRGAGGQALGQLAQGKRQQRQRLPAVGVRDERRYQAVLETQPGHLRRSFDDLAQHLPVQRSHHMSLDRHPGQRGQITQVIQELRAHRRDHLHRAGHRLAQQRGESSQSNHSGAGEQLLGLINRHQQPPLMRPRTSRHQVISHPAQAISTGFEPVADLTGRPAHPQTMSGRRQRPGQLGQRISPRHHRRHRHPRRITAEQRHHPRIKQRRLPTPRRTDEGQHPTRAPPRAQPIAHLTNLRRAPEKHPATRRGKRLQPRERILPLPPRPPTIIQQPHRLQHPSTSLPRISQIIHRLQTPHQRMHHPNLRTQRHQPAPQRTRDPHLSRTPTRRHKRRRHHPHHRVNPPQLTVETLLPILTHTNTLTKIMIEKRLMTRPPQPPGHLLSNHPIRSGITDKNASHDHPQSLGRHQGR
jgi:hypothetical protein